MPSTINSTTTAGVAVSGDNSGVLALQTNNGTTAVTIDTSQNVGIGTTSPQARLDVRTAGAAANLFVVSDISTSALASRIGLGNTAGPVRMSIGLNGTASELAYVGTEGNFPMYFQTNGTERMRIPAAGGVQAVTTISVGNATPSSSGAGITFPATQSASSDANTLDDYEEGTWTPTITRNTTQPTITYGAQDGRYVKIGRIVYASCNVSWSTNTGGSGVNWFISGLPFTNSSASGNYSQGTIQDFNGITFAASRTQFGGYVNTFETRFFLCSGGSAQSTDNITVGASGYMYMSVVYIASA